MKNNRRFIEETFPVKEVGAESSREKNIQLFPFYLPPHFFNLTY